MGHTGAAMVASMKVLGTLPGVDRPCLASVLPNMTGRPTVLLDVGANIDCRPEHIAQFAVMGSVYAEEVLGIDRPRVGVLSVGEEDGKGSATTKEAAQALRDVDLNFLGNAEGRDIWNGKFDVIACDGFVGNAMLKSVRGPGRGPDQRPDRRLHGNLVHQAGRPPGPARPRRFKQEAGLRRVRRRPAAGGQGHHHHRPRPQQRPRRARTPSARPSPPASTGSTSTSSAPWPASCPRPRPVRPDRDST